ncbi:MAG: hypothetical protein OMM_01512 [Candidatus Magnetoglobus multicellularis str. Araruama]|uniref:Uncharacterized protein n=1 Tax=Candidatus Magnetoglobus multicellularis str. Araruama TaxID=890399 RepID=A0A1V1PCT0_9BACT|nr:MAG: hypothetical protein OMM_01512 [Candidatus Magnetoglobus multicellularis str. Araruama]
MKYYLSIICIILISGVYVFAYNFGDAIHNIHPDMQGNKSATEIIQLLDKIFSKVRSDDESIAFLHYLDESLQKFDFRLLYKNPTLQPLDNDFRGVTLQGINESDHYFLGLSPDKKDDIVNQTIGSFASEIALKQIDKSIVGYRSFLAYMDTELALKQYSHHNLLLFADSLLKIIDPDNLAELNPPESNVFTNISGDARVAINSFYYSFPKLASLLDRYIEVNSLLKTKYHETISYTHFDFSVSCKYDALQKDYPLVSDYLEQFRNVLQTGVESINANGHKIFKLEFDCSPDFFNFSIYTKDGKIVPFDSNGIPVFADAFSLASLKKYYFKLVTRLLFDAYGLKYFNNNIITKGTYVNTREFAVLNLRLDSVSKTKVYGRKYHIFPKWFIDFIIPDNIDQLIYELVTVMLHANDDEGSFVKFEFDKRLPNENYFNSLASSEYVDNFFIKLELGIWRNILRTDQATVDEMNGLIIRGLNAVLHDLERIDQ